MRALDTLEDLRVALGSFAEERDWAQFHSPKNLASALVVEAAELLEVFQWLREDESTNLSAKQLHAVSQEMADVLLYLVRLADTLGVDLLLESSRKLELNAERYPIAKARGSSLKYTEF